MDSSSLGNPASPVLANLVMNYILKKIEGRLHFLVPFLKVKNNRTLFFLDMNIIRNKDGFIVTNWYDKPTSSGRCINYNSNHLMSQKVVVIKGLLFRVLTLSNISNKVLSEVSVQRSFRASDQVDRCLVTKAPVPQHIFWSFEPDTRSYRGIVSKYSPLQADEKENAEVSKPISVKTQPGSVKPSLQGDNKASIGRPGKRA
ncbi:hypothetical protein M0804_013217 [Polistes exclamans]|nr:hypothetical protein M0804_013217 [Polistes exclamans]